MRARRGPAPADASAVPTRVSGPRISATGIGLALSVVMARSFVALNDSVHGLLRSLTRQVALCPSPARDGLPTVQYQVRPEGLPEAYYSLAVFHALEGRPAGAALARPCGILGGARAAVAERVWYFDAVRLDRRCCRDLRLKLSKQGPGLLGAELLAYGVGALRAANDNPSVRIHRHLWRQYGRLRTPHETCFARILALHRQSPHLPGAAGKETFFSTNLIYGDTLGELEQLWERRAESGLLEQVARSLRGLRGRGEVAAFMCPPVNCEGIMDLHLRAQALWRTPPASGRVLLRRLEYILGNTRVESQPETLFRWLTPKVESPVSPVEPGLWRPDGSGYDGWLSESE